MVSFPGRAYGVALRLLLPRLDRDYVAEAVAAFEELRQEARSEGVRAAFRFYRRELKSLLAAALAESRQPEPEVESPTSNLERPAPGKNSPRRQEPPGPGAALARTLDALTLDLRYSLRNLARAPGFVAVSVLSLTFGIAVSTVLFSLANAVFLRPLPHAETPDELVRIFSGYGPGTRAPLSMVNQLDIQAMSSTLEDVAVVRDRALLLGDAREGTQEVWGVEASANYFDVLGISLVRGRGFLPEDIDQGGHVAVLGHRLWKTRFRGSEDVLGRTIHINGHLYTVIGVGPEGMVGVEGPALSDLVIPAMDGRGERGWRSYTAVARKLPGVTKQQVQAELDALAAHLLEEYPENWGSESAGARRFEVTTLHEAMIPDGAPLGLIVAAFLGVVGLILLIACSNVANLLLTRALERRGEIAIRSAIGGASRRIMAQLLTESLVLFAMAGALSVLVTHWLASLAAAGAGLLPSPAVSVTVDARVVLFALGMALVTGLTFGLVPALQASRPNLVPALKGREAPPRFRLFGVRNLLVGAQVGGSLVLVLVTMLLLQSLVHARSLDLGFDPHGVAVLMLDLDDGDYGEVDGRQFLEDLRRRVEALPDVQSTALATRIPLAGGSSAFGGLKPEGYEAAGRDGVTIGFAAVSPGYLDLVGIRLLRGRDFNRDDRPDGEQVVLASQALIDRFWPGESGLGRHIASGDEETLTVVGVVEDIPWQNPAEEAQAFLWFPTTQWWDSNIVVHVRSRENLANLLPQLRAQVVDLNPDLPVRRLDLMASVSANGTLLNRILSGVFGVAGLVTLSLAMLGIYGVVSFSVRQRTREVGLRIAVGAEPGQVVRMVVREGLGLALMGLVPGLLVALGVARLMRAALLGLSPLDPVAFLGGTAVLLVAVAGACLSPALRAARADPMDSLRME